MPGVEVMGASVDAHALERPLLRTHKVLPRRGVAVPNIRVVQPDSLDQNGSAVTAAPAPPLTPPGVGQEQLASGEESTPGNMDSSISDFQTAGMLTPRRPSKPPTPDVTPPRTNSTQRPFLNSLVYLSSSSRTGSFQTARESISSDGDKETPIRSSRSTSQAVKRNAQSSRSNGLNGFHSKVADAKETPPPASQQLSETEYETGLESFDGEWTTSQADGSPIPRAGTRKPTRDYGQSGGNPDVDRDALDVRRLDASLTHEKSLRDRVHDTHEVTASPSMKRFCDDIGWPSDGSPSHAEDPDVRRLSGISSTSTVEAMIIDSPKRAQRTLRHTEKKSSLRSASSPITRSEHTSIASSRGSQHRLIHKAARISDQDRRSVSSDLSFSSKTTISLPQANVDIIPVVVIPERRSSLQSAPNSRGASKPSSKPGSQRSSRHPPTAPLGSADGPRQHKRTMSDSVSARPQEKEERGRHLGRPVIPPRSSSLSAPTSRNNSRATSLTSQSLRSHTLAMDLEMQKSREQQPVSPPRHNILGPQDHHSLEPPNLRALLVGSDDMSTLRPPSLPYTAGSIPSSSPGPIEISEATAVSLFAHHNESLLLIDPRDQSESLHTLRALQKDLQGERVTPQTPDMPLAAALIGVESPLKNPRPPPKPPICKPLPPLPSQDDDARDGQKSSGRLSRWNSVRRTWGARPRSDSFNSLARSLSMRSARNRKAGVEMDSRLHPFWRPRGFWEDVPGSSPPKNSSPVRRNAQNSEEPLIVSNSLGLPQRRLVFDGPPALARRSPEMRRLVDGMSSRGSLVDHGILRTGSPLYRHRFQALSRWRVRFHWMSLRNIRARLRRVHQSRDEQKRAARRESLKQRIGVPVYVASSAPNGVTAR